MSRKKKSTSKSETPAAGKTVKLNTINPDPVITPLGAAAPKTKLATPAVAVDASGLVKKPEFLERATEKTDVKKRDAKPAIEAALAVLAQALIDGEELNLPPLGKIRVVKSKDLGRGAKALTLKLRTMKDKLPEDEAASTSDDAKSGAA